MSTRPTSTGATSTGVTSTGATATIAVLTAVTALLAACGTGTGGSGGAAISTTTVPPVTVTVTQTPTATPSTSLPSTSPSSPGKPNTTMSIPPPAKDPVTIPDNPKAYGQAFVTAWVERDQADASRLGTTAAVDTAFGSTVRTAPKFIRCEGAAGSSYCTWEGDEYTMTVRVLNEAASQRQMHAVAEVKFAH